MAGIIVDFNSGEVSLTATVAKTVLQIAAAAHHRVKLLKACLSGKGIVVTDTPMKVRILRQTDAGTMTTGTNDVHRTVRDRSVDETLQTSVFINATAEPTPAGVHEMLELHPQNMVMWYYPTGQEQIIKGGDRLGFEFTAAQNQTVVVSGAYEE